MGITVAAFARGTRVPVTEVLARFASELELAQVPPPAVISASLGIADCLACMIAGAHEPAVQIVSAMIATPQGGARAPEYPAGRLVAAPDAALINGVAAHALDYDDVAMAAHPSAVLAPAILAQAWSLDATGAETLTAYVAGYEVWAQLDALESRPLHERGFHPTAIYGAVAAAAACARLRGLDALRTRHALGIGASLAAGLVANFGTMTKPLHAGRAAQSGVLAADLAARGFDAAPDVFEHRTGFLRAFSPSDAPRLQSEDMDIGKRWRLAERGLDIKRYPTCYATHRCIDSMLQLTQEHDLAAADIARIDVLTGATQLLLLRNPEPRNALEAKFSMQFALAAALVAREVGLQQVTDSFVQRADIREAVKKVTCATTSDKMPGDELFAPQDLVSVTLLDGRRLQSPPVTHAKGSSQRPLTSAEFEQKFKDCTRSMDAAQANLLLEQLRTLSTLKTVRDLCAA